MNSMKRNWGLIEEVLRSLERVSLGQPHVVIASFLFVSRTMENLAFSRKEA